MGECDSFVMFSFKSLSFSNSDILEVLRMHMSLCKTERESRPYCRCMAEDAISNYCYFRYVCQLCTVN